MAKKDQGAAPAEEPVADLQQIEPAPAEEPVEHQASLNQCNAQLFAMLLGQTPKE